jgi:hypothetical protein
MGDFWNKSYDYLKNLNYVLQITGFQTELLHGCANKLVSQTAPLFFFTFFIIIIFFFLLFFFIISFFRTEKEKSI